MSEYRRFIAYVYEYVQEQKGSNRGFIKVEARDGICKMDFRLTGMVNPSQGNFKIYGYVREPRECKAIYLGTCMPKGDKLECRVQTSEKQIGKTQFTLEDLGGIVILGEGQRMYGTEWDDHPIRLQEFSFTWNQGKDKEQDSPPAEASSPSENEKEAGPEEAQPEINPENNQESSVDSPETEDTQEAEEVQDEEIKPEQDSEKPVAQPAEDALPSEDMVQSDAEMQSAQDSQEESVPELTIEEVQQIEGIRQLKAEKETYCPFADQDMIECYKITPRELFRVNRRDQAMANNNFLLHGFYNYHHLIFGKQKDTNQYILGVPGIYDHQEKFMAGMFGFPYFKAANLPKEEETAMQMGQFGYWYRLIDTPDFDDGDSF